MCHGREGRRINGGAVDSELFPSPNARLLPFAAHRRRSLCHEGSSRESKSCKRSRCGRSRARTCDLLPRSRQEYSLLWECRGGQPTMDTRWQGTYILRTTCLLARSCNCTENSGILLLQSSQLNTCQNENKCETHVGILKAQRSTYPGSRCYTACPFRTFW